MDTEQLITEMKGHRTDDAQAMSAYLRNQFPFLGLKSVARRNITKSYFKDAKQEARALSKVNPGIPIIDWNFVQECWQQEEREFQYVATDYLNDMQTYLKKDDINHLKKLITTKSWWDSVDALVKRVGYLQTQYPELKETIIEWSVSDNLWLRRVAIIHQLSMKEATDTQLLTRTIMNNLGSDEFFINKAIGWALRDYARINEEWVKNFLRQYQTELAPLSIREASKHINI